MPPLAEFLTGVEPRGWYQQPDDVLAQCTGFFESPGQQEKILKLLRAKEPGNSSSLNFSPASSPSLNPASSALHRRDFPIDVDIFEVS